MTDLANLSYGDLLALLRKDLQLDATIDIQPGTILASLIDQNGFAAFPQLLAAQRIRLAFGRATFAGNNTLRQSITIPHGLGVIPVVAFGQPATSIPGGGSNWQGFAGTNNNADATNLYLFASSDDVITPATNFALGSTYYMNWFALG